MRAFPKSISFPRNSGMAIPWMKTPGMNTSLPSSNPKDFTAPAVNSMGSLPLSLKYAIAHAPQRIGVFIPLQPGLCDLTRALSSVASIIFS
jgi:hypothetical protein